jgi:hypothetical protein
LRLCANPASGSVARIDCSMFRPCLTEPIRRWWYP